jgi:hypothetical protein
MLTTLGSDELTPRIYKRQSLDGNHPTEYDYCLDRWFFGLQAGLSLSRTDAVPIPEVSGVINTLLGQGHDLAYWSGGFDLGFHDNTIENLSPDLPPDVRLIVGIESNEYIERKGRKAQFDQIERLSAVGLMLKQIKRLGCMFPIPPRGDAQATPFYDGLVKEIGMYRRPSCYHLYSDDDPYKEIKEARMLEPKSWCCFNPLRDITGRVISTTSLLQE